LRETADEEGELRFRERMSGGILKQGGVVLIVREHRVLSLSVFFLSFSFKETYLCNMLCGLLEELNRVRWLLLSESTGFSLSLFF
jgi:hypothetical protein